MTNRSPLLNLDEFLDSTVFGFILLITYPVTRGSASVVLNSGIRGKTSRENELILAILSLYPINSTRSELVAHSDISGIVCMCRT
jgi:hypothetical protein